METISNTLFVSCTYVVRVLTMWFSVFSLLLLLLFLHFKIEFVSFFIVSIVLTVLLLYLFRADSLIMCQYQACNQTLLQFHFFLFFFSIQRCTTFFSQSYCIICHSMSRYYHRKPYKPRKQHSQHFEQQIENNNYEK